MRSALTIIWVWVFDYESWESTKIRDTGDIQISICIKAK